MSQYKIKHVCGHEETHQIYGTNKNGQRERKADWLATTPCPDCYRAENETKRKNISSIAAEQNAKAGMPELIGSAKQIAWAETLRQKAHASLNPFCEQLRPLAAKGQDAATIALSIVERLFANDVASWWIDNRDISYDRRWISNQVIKQLR